MRLKTSRMMMTEEQVVQGEALLGHALALVLVAVVGQHQQRSRR
jgi:hypothetical protein